MLLFILESLGTSELILIGIVALVFLGPRKLPELAKKAGKIIAEFRGTASEFKETWKREVDFDEERKAFDINELEKEPIPRATRATEPEIVSAPPPVLKEIDPADFDRARSAQAEIESAEAANTVDQSDIDHATATDSPSPADDKKNWL